MALVLNHYTIRTIDVDRCRNFYETVLGLINGPRPAFDFPGAWMYRADPSDPNNAVVHIIGVLHDPDERLLGSAAVDHIAFSATGLENMLAHLTQNNIPFRERTVPGLNLHQVFLHDPLQIKIELNYSKQEKEALDSRCA
ncbi:MAG: VOC family protein [Pseudomonadota bacterium]